MESVTEKSNFICALLTKVREILGEKLGLPPKQVEQLLTEHDFQNFVGIVEITGRTTALFVNSNQPPYYEQVEFPSS